MNAADFLTIAETAYSAGRASEAQTAYRQVLAHAPGHPVALRKLAWLANYLQNVDEAIDLLKELIAVQPGDALAHQDLGLCLIQMKQFEPAIAALQKATQVDPTYGPAFCNLGLALEDHGDLPAAIEALRRALQLGHHKEFVAYHLAAIEWRAGQTQHAPPTCPPSYLVPLFDGYADRFDQHLFQTLSYCGPSLLAEIVSAHCQNAPATPWDVLDLGCGTGMTAVPFRAQAKHVVGVDLSPRMLQRAAQRTMPNGRRVYDSVMQADLTAALEQFSSRFDLILSADVFIYIGDLAPIFQRVAKALRPGGLFAFTVESHAGSEDYVLLPTRRYAQSWGYIARLIAESGMQLIAEQPADLRMGDDAKPVHGTVYLSGRVLVPSPPVRRGRGLG